MTPNPTLASSAEPTRAPGDRSVDRQQWHWRWLSAIALLLAVMAISPLVQSPIQYQIEWLLTLSELHGSAVRFGTKVMFTYGPWGFAWGGYHPKTFPLICVTWTVFGGLFWWAACRIASPSRLGCGGVRAGVVLIGLALLLQGHRGEYSDSRLFLISFLLLLNHFVLSSRPVDLLTLALSAAAAFSGAIKFPYLVTGLVAIGIITIDQLVLVRRRAVWPLGVYVVTFLLAWVSSGQSLGDLPTYLRTSVEMTAGYAEPMALTLRHAFTEIVLFLVIVLMTAGLLSQCPPVDWRRRGLMLLAMAVLTLTVFRASYVRHDSHAVIGSGLLGFFVPAVVVAMWHGLRSSRLRKLAIGCVAMALGLQVLEDFRYDEHHVSLSPRATARDVKQFAGELIHIARGQPTTPAVAYEAMLQTLREANPLPPMRGTVDLVPYETTILLAHHLNYDPRPTLQSYAAYTPSLARANADKYAGPDAPQNVVFRVDAIDGRLPSLEDNLLWLELLKRYRSAGEYGRYLHLVPRAAPRTLRMTPLATATAQLGQPIPVPRPRAGGLIWAQLDTAPRFIGKLAAQLYKPPPLWLTVTLVDGSQSTFRFMVANGANGFLLGPMVTTNGTFAALLDRPTSTDDLQRSLMPASVTLYPPNNSIARAYFRPDVGVQFFEINETTE